MNISKKIFDAFEKNDHLNESEEKNFYSSSDPFDFYRKTVDPEQYIPKTQRGLRKAFFEDLIGIEFFIEMATSLRPLVDEAQDVDEITRLFSQQKLSSRPNSNSVRILKNMIKDPNAEIALYAAEGLNTIENSFICKIQRIKDKTSKKKGKLYILYYILGLLYLKFSKLLEGQPLIQQFYLNESLNYLKQAHSLLKKNNKRILYTMGETYILLKKYNTAIKIFSFLSSKDENDLVALFKLAECYYYLRDFDKLIEYINQISKSQDIYTISEPIIYQWIL
ncbi:MAG: hypothetical protein SVR08_01105 [Spirochaetota bacterium]|nr:hypothetical protein [Spirochaetota bacterium]